MNILVYGAGVLGSLYAARLHEAGQHVSLLARGHRLQDTREHGIVIADVLTGRITTTHVEVVEQLGPEDHYDLAIVVMGKQHVVAILPQLAANKRIPSVMFLHNIDAALKTHAVFITCMESAVVLAGDNNKLASRRDLLLLMVTAIRQGFKGLRACGLPIVPFNLKLMFMWMPKWFPVLYWQRTLQSKLGEYSLDAHAKAAPAEVRQLIAEIRTLLGDTTASIPAMDQLFRDIDAIATSSSLSQ
jgi:ketopantoate reductase